MRVSEERKCTRRRELGSAGGSVGGRERGGYEKEDGRWEEDPKAGTGERMQRNEVMGNRTG